MARAENSYQSKVPPVVLFFLVIAALYFAREILIPLSIAVLLAFLLTPAVRRLELWKLGRVPSVILVATLSLVLVLGVGWTVTSQLVEAISHLPEYRENIEKKVNSINGPSDGPWSRISRSMQELGKELAPPPAKDAPVKPIRELSRTQRALSPPPSDQKPVPVEVVERPPNAAQYASNLIGPLLAPVGMAVIVIVFTIVMLIRREDLRNRLLRLSGVDQLTLVTKALEDAATRVSNYLRMQFLVNATFGVLLAIALSIIGVPTPMLWGFLAGLARFVPYVGPLIGGSLPFIVSLAVFPGWQQPLLTLGVFIVIELTVAYAVEPWLYGAHTGISSLAILVSAAFWTAIWGPIGLVVATPLTTCLVVLGRHVPRLEFLHVILGDEPVLPPPAQLYQRILALDRQEAQAVVNRFAADMTPCELYDGVIIPALALAEEDRHRGALDDVHERFVTHIMVEFIEKLTNFDAESDACMVATVGPASHLRMVCIAAADQADELVGAMLAQTLQSIDVSTVGLPFEPENMDALRHLMVGPGQLVCISALPPFALLSARTLSKKLREQYPDLSIVVGLWGMPDERAYSERLHKAFGVEVVTSLKEAIAVVERIRESELSVS